MIKDDIFNQSKARMLYENEVTKNREKHRKELGELRQHLVVTGMHRQGPGYAQYIDLVNKHIGENAEAFMVALLDSITTDRKLNEESEKILIDEMLNNLNQATASCNSDFRRKLISEGWEQDESFCQSMFSQLPRESLSTGQFLTNKIRLKVIAINEEYDRKHKIALEKDTSSMSTGSDRSSKISEKLVKHPIIFTITVLGSIASIIALIFVFFPLTRDVPNANSSYNVFIMYYPSTKRTAQSIHKFLMDQEFDVRHFQEIPEGKLKPRISEIIYYSEISKIKSGEMQKLIVDRTGKTLPLSKSEFFGDENSIYKIYVNLFQ